MTSRRRFQRIPALRNMLFALTSALVLVFAFPDFEFSFLAYFALIPLFFAINSERNSLFAAFLLGWIWGTSFFFGTCWWLAYAPTHYAGVAAPIAYALVFAAAAIAAVFPAIFAATFAFFLGRIGRQAYFAVPFLWVALEFARYWITGNDWNAIGYSQAFQPRLVLPSSFGGVYLVSFFIVGITAAIFVLLFGARSASYKAAGISLLTLVGLQLAFIFPSPLQNPNPATANLFAIQANVPMSGLNEAAWRNLRERHEVLSEAAIAEFDAKEANSNSRQRKKVIVFPESPMNFSYTNDPELQNFLREFASKNQASVLFNSAEPSRDGGFYNSVVMVDERGEKILQYDKIYLLPFGEFVPLSDSLAEYIPALVGSFRFGNEYDLFPLGEAKGGVMVCFESHFPDLAREYIRRGADVLIEMTNDGYLGPTPVLRQHLANAVFRAVETNRPVLRVTNVGITAYINERGEVLDATEPYNEATRVWGVAKSTGDQTMYVRFGDWFAWLCVAVSLAFVFASFRKPKTAIR